MPARPRPGRRSASILVALRTWLLRALFLLVVALASARPTAAQVTEYDVKAAYLFNFLQFVTWPPTAFASAASPLQLCVAGRDSLGTLLRNLTRTEVVGGRGITVTIVQGTDDLQRCHLLFLSDGTPAAGSLRAVASRPVLTVGESEDFLAAGGMIRFVVSDNRVRFDVSTRPAARAGLTLSSRLLQVARQVQR